VAGKVRKLTSLAIALTVVCLVAASFPQFNVVSPTPVMANPDTSVPNAAGADCYLAKPFSYQELAARVKALFRRYEWSNEKNYKEATQQPSA